MKNYEKPKIVINDFEEEILTSSGGVDAEELLNVTENGWIWGE